MRRKQCRVRTSDSLLTLKDESKIKRSRSDTSTPKKQVPPKTIKNRRRDENLRLVSIFKHDTSAHWEINITLLNSFIQWNLELIIRNLPT